MKRAKIEEQAAVVVVAALAKLNASGAEMLTSAADKMEDFYRATLEEAARAVCVFCAHERDCVGALDAARPSDLRGIPWLHASRCQACDAGGIHDLIAALDKEAKGE